MSMGVRPQQGQAVPHEPGADTDTEDDFNELEYSQRNSPSPPGMKSRGIMMMAATPDGSGAENAAEQRVSYTNERLKRHNGNVFAALLDDLAERFPSQKKRIHTVAPFLIKVLSVIDYIFPYIVGATQTAQGGWDAMAVYHPEYLLPGLIGFSLCFFGGSFMMTIAAAESVRLTTWQQMSDAYFALADNYLRARHASDTDNTVDTDGDGIADVQELDSNELLTRKIYLFLSTVDPQQVSDAWGALWVSALSVVAALRVKFMQTVTLGASIGDLASKRLRRIVFPTVCMVLPPEVQNWSSVLTDYIFRTFGCLVAWVLSRFIKALHSSVRGAHMLTANGIRIAHRKGFLSTAVKENGVVGSLFTAVLAIMGFYFQLSNHFGLPFPLNVLLFPATLVEWNLELWVSWL